MAQVAVMALFPVTQGACHGVPISGVPGPVLTGQLTKPMSLSTGAARSEPRAIPDTAAACRAGVRQ